jgi:t-SNARE complex subunit (syntaxin)
MSLKEKELSKLNLNNSFINTSNFTYNTNKMEKLTKQENFKEVEKELRDLTTICKDLNLLIQKNQEQFNILEDSIHSSNYKIETSIKDLEEAEIYKQESRWYKLLVGTGLFAGLWMLIK